MNDLAKIEQALNKANMNGTFTLSESYEIVNSLVNLREFITTGKIEQAKSKVNNQEGEQTE